MTDLHWTDGKTTIVVPASVRGRFSGSAKAFQRLVCAIAVVVATVLGSMWITADAYADDSSSTGTDANSSVTITDNITDTENLLGSHATEVSDAIAKTEKETGVHVHLLYLSSFNSEQTPQKWASTVLESTKPKANTVLLAVAANGKAHDLVLRVIACGQKQYGCVDALLTDATGYGEAVNVRQHYIQHDEVGLYLFDDFDGFRTGGRGVHLESGKMQRGDEQFADGRFVINNNNRCFNRLTHVLQIGLLHWTFPECPLGVRPQIPARLRKPARFRLRNPS